MDPAWPESFMSGWTCGRDEGERDGVFAGRR